MKITREQLKQIILEELNESNRSQLDAKFTQDVADFEQIVTAISNAYGDQLVRDVATELVRMVLDPPTGPNFE